MGFLIIRYFINWVLCIFSLGRKAYGGTKKCVFCDGKGIMTALKQIRPGMIIQQEFECQKCDGTGETIQEKDRCKKCKGIKTVSEKKIYQINIDKGTQDGEKIVFYGEADQEVFSFFFFQI